MVLARAFGITDADGRYTIYDLVPGTYRVNFTNSDALYHGEFFGDDAYYISQAADIVIGENTRIENVNSALAGISLNVAPLAVADALVVQEAGTADELVDARRSLLVNDEDAEGATLTASLVISSTNGNVTLNEDGTFVYEHDGSETTSDSFSYAASDGTNLSEVIEVTISIQPQNNAPVAVDDTLVVEEVGSADTLADAQTSILHNDTDAEEAELTATLVKLPANGMITFNTDGTFIYEHDGSETTSDSFTYTVSDGVTESEAATVAVTVQPLADMPVAMDDAISVQESGTTDVLTDSTLSLLDNDVDADSDTLVATLVVSPTNGTLTLNADGTFVYTHDGSETTSDSFTYSVSDGANVSQVATVTIAIEPQDDAPVAAADTIELEQGATIAVLASGESTVLANDSDVDSDALTVEVDTEPTAGTLTLNSNGTFTYTHDGSDNLSDSFTYTVSDDNSNSEAATVTISLSAKQQEQPSERSLFLPLATR